MQALLRAVLTAVLVVWFVKAALRETDNRCPESTRCLPRGECPSDARGLRRCASGALKDGVCCERTAATEPHVRSVRRAWATRAPTSTARPSPNPRLVAATPQPAGRTTPAPATPSGRACAEIRRTKSARNRRALETPLPRLFVVGGEIAQMSEFPYMVAVGYARGNDNNNNSAVIWGCGGSLISQRYVLTAAHCITDARDQNLRPVILRAGVNKLSEGPRAPGDYSVESFVLHPKHRPALKYFDLALLRTDREVTLSPAVQPVCLPAPADRVDNTTLLIAAGWGATDPTGFMRSADLKKADLRFIPLDECKKIVPASSGIPQGLGNDMMCVADPKGESDTCRGDSGGPLVARASGEDTLVGVTSFGGNPCAGSRPGVYARTAPELAWIESIVWP